MTGFGLTRSRPLPGGRCGLHAAQAGRVDGALDEARAPGLCHPRGDVGERGGTALGKRERELHDVQPVVEDARAGQPIRQSEEHEAILRVRVGLPLADQLEGGGLAVRGRELGVLERALEHEGGGRAASMARTATSQAPVFASSIRRAIVVYSMGAKPTPASAASARPSMNAVPESSPVSRFLLAMTGLPVKRAARSSPRGASSALMDGLGAVSRPAQPATSATPTMPAMTRAALLEGTTAL